MPAFKFVINDPETRKSYQLEVDQSKATGLIGKKIGDEFSGDFIGLPGYSLQISGGTDRDGFPMHPNVRGSVRKRILLTSAPCFHPRMKGERRRKTVRGNTISESIVQINVKILKKGEKPIEELVPVKVKEKKEETKPEKKPEVKENVEEKKEEKKPEEVKEKPKEEKPKEEVKTGGGEGKK